VPPRNLAVADGCRRGRGPTRPMPALAGRCILLRGPRKNPSELCIGARLRRDSDTSRRQQHLIVCASRAACWHHARGPIPRPSAPSRTDIILPWIFRSHSHRDGVPRRDEK
jgi:hypothetical protein